MKTKTTNGKGTSTTKVTLPNKTQSSSFVGGRPDSRKGTKK